MIMINIVKLLKAGRPRSCTADEESKNGGKNRIVNNEKKRKAEAALELLSMCPTCSKMSTIEELYDIGFADAQGPRGAIAFCYCLVDCALRAHMFTLP